MRAYPTVAAKLTHERRVVDVGPSGALRVVVVADTHGRPDPRSLPLVQKQRPDLILHAGDIGAPRVLDELAAIAPLVAVRGNIDAKMPGVPDTVTLEVRDQGRTIVTMLLLHIAVYGPKLRADAARLAREEGARVVVCGHSHVPFLGEDRGIAVFNAGSIGPRRFTLPIVFGVVEVRSSGVGMHHVSCETGERWRP
jgi:putative phosphoesterase